MGPDNTLHKDAWISCRCGAYGRMWCACGSQSSRRGCARTKLLSYGIATVQDGTLERMDVSGAPGVRWEEREKLEDAVTASSRRMRDMLCVQGRGKRKKRNRGARNWF